MKIIKDTKKNLTFSTALNALFKGHKVTRSVWNGYLFLSHDTQTVHSAVKHGAPLIADDTSLKTRFGKQFGLKNHRPHQMAVPKGTMIIAKLNGHQGYLPARLYQVDILAHDWEIIG